MTKRQRQLLTLLAAAVLLVAWVWLQNADNDSSGGQDRDPDRGAAATTESGTGQEVDPTSGLSWVDLQDLPPEAAETVDLIDSGGPFPEERDGLTFENREGILPDRERGYYQEYTVPTPGSDDRGARRIVTGSGGDEFYWTADHYESFERIRR